MSDVLTCGRQPGDLLPNSLQRRIVPELRLSLAIPVGLRDVVLEVGRRLG